MIELNLLPAVKLEYIKAQNQRRMIFSVAVLFAAACLGLFIILVVYSQLQKTHMADLSRDIASKGQTLKRKPQINKILTVQNQLNSLTELHASKPAASSLFDYLNQVTPTTLSISDFHIDFAAYTASITGDADTLSSVNKYIDTLKYTNYTTDENTDTKVKGFHDVVLSTFALNQVTQAGQPQANNHQATYTITLAYDPVIFDITQKIKLDVPTLITTRAAIDQPTDLFQDSASAKGSN